MVRSKALRAILLGVALVAGGCDGARDEPDAPPECITAWRAQVTAPVHCEEYPDAYQAIQKELER